MFNVPGKANDGEKIRFAMQLTSEEFLQNLRQLFPSIGNVPFDLCSCTGSSNADLETIEDRTPSGVKTKIKKGALYLRMQVWFNYASIYNNSITQPHCILITALTVLII